MSAFRGKADMTVYRSPLSRSLLGVKRTWLVAAHMSAFDPKRTWVGVLQCRLTTAKADIAKPFQKGQLRSYNFSGQVRCGGCEKFIRAHRDIGGFIKAVSLFSYRGSADEQFIRTHSSHVAGALRHTTAC